MKRQNWVPIAVLVLAGGLALAGAGLLGNGLLQAAHELTAPTTSTSPPSPTALPRATPSIATPTTTSSAGQSTSPSATPSPVPTSSPSPNATAVECWFGDFPYYPDSLAVAGSAPGAHAWHVYAPADEVARYYTNGASQLAWQFRLVSQQSMQWNYRMSRQPACSGNFFVRADPAGGTLFQATPDS